MPSSPSIVPPKSQSTTSPSRITRSPGSWWGLAALAPAATMAKFTRWWPSARRRRPSSADTCASVRPTSSMSPAWSSAATRSAAAPARRSASTSAASLRARSGPITSLPRVKHGGRQGVLEVDHEPRPGAVADGDGGSPCRRARRRSPPGRRSRPTSGARTRRAAPRRAAPRAAGTTSVASPSAGSTSMVSRSSGIAS